MVLLVHVSAFSALSSLELQNMSSNVKNYTDDQILNAVEKLPEFTHFPENYWVCGIRSNEDEFNNPDDKFYLYKGKKFIKVFCGTTNAGNDLLNPDNPKGEAVVEAGHIFYDVWTRRLHRGKVMAWCQCKPMAICRDNDKDTRTEELTKAIWEIVGINFHPMDYLKGSRIPKRFINGWSLGCQCPQVRADFDEVMGLTVGQNFLTYALLDEF